MLSLEAASAADLLPRSLLRVFAGLTSRWGAADGNYETTGLTREQWKALGRAFPDLGSDPASRVLVARRRREFLIGRALATRRHDAVWTSEPEASPVLFASAHIGDARALKYLLRQRIPVASIRPPWKSRTEFARQDAAFDRLWPRPFPQVFSAAAPHALRSALRQGSLIATADTPARDGYETGLLGGTVRLDLRPFRLARLAGVPCRPAFLTAPRGRLTVTIGDPLPVREEAAVKEFGRAFAVVAAAAPFEIDGPTRWGQIR
jgi:hypothetical protein